MDPTRSATFPLSINQLAPFWRGLLADVYSRHTGLKEGLDFSRPSVFVPTPSYVFSRSSVVCRRTAVSRRLSKGGDPLPPCPTAVVALEPAWPHPPAPTMVPAVRPVLSSWKTSSAGGLSLPTDGVGI